MPENYKYGGGADASLLHPIVAILLVLGIIAILVLPRKYGTLPLLWMVMLTPSAQQIFIGGVHLFALRLFVLVGLIRMFASPKGTASSRFAGGITGIDKAFSVCILAQAMSSMLLFHEVAAVVYQVGFIWDWLGGYFLLRWLLRDEEDVFRGLKFLAVLMLPVVAGMIIEQARTFNVFSILGGLPASPEIREGKTRSQGIFLHSLMAGSFGATLMPAFLLLWKQGKSKFMAILGVFGATLMAMTSNSSTPLIAFAAGIFALLCWPLRKSMKKVKIGIVVALVCLQIVMKAPVWFLIARVDLTGGSSSYHRAQLVDQFINHFRDWWLIGVADSSSWGLDMWDVQNQYVNVGEAGGLLALVFFILLISRSFGRLGEARKIVDGDKTKEWTLWYLGASLFANVAGFFGVNYFDQSRFGWFFLLATISVTTSQILATSPALPVDTEESGTRARFNRLKRPFRQAGKTRPIGQPVSRLLVSPQ